MKHPEVISEPRPGPLHLICALCREQFKDFIEHIFSVKHLTVGVKDNQEIFDDIDKTMKDLPIGKNKPKLIKTIKNVEKDEKNEKE